MHTHTAFPEPEVHALPAPEDEYLRGIAPALTGPVLFACWWTLDGPTVCRTLSAGTTALAAHLPGPFDPSGEIDEEPLIAALADAIPELCHPCGYALTGIGIAAPSQGGIEAAAWMAQADGRARTWQRHTGGAEASGRIEPDDHVVYSVSEAGLLAVLERLRARATGTEPVVPESPGPTTAGRPAAPPADPAAAHPVDPDSSCPGGATMRRHLA